MFPIVAEFMLSLQIAAKDLTEISVTVKHEALAILQPGSSEPLPAETTEGNENEKRVRSCRPWPGSRGAASVLLPLSYRTSVGRHIQEFQPGNETLPFGRDGMDNARMPWLNEA